MKKIVFPLFSLFLLYRMKVHLKDVLSYDNSELTLSYSLFIGFIFSLYITGIFAFVGFVFPTNRLLPESYYRIKDPGFIIRIYKSLGLVHFKKVLLIFFWGMKKNRKKYFDGTKSGLQNLVYQSRQSEFGHLAAFVMVLGLTIFLLGLGYWTISIFMVLFNIIGNLYPVILQRHHRMRIQRIVNS